MGEVVWVGRGVLGATDGKVALYMRGDAARLVAEPADPPAGDLHDRLRDHLRSRGAGFFRDIYGACGGGGEGGRLDASGGPVWSGGGAHEHVGPPVPPRPPGPRA